VSRPSDIRVDVDTGLVEALCRDDADAAERLVERYGDAVYRLAMRITGVTDDAEAAARDALDAAARRIETLTGEPAFGAWIDRLAARAAYERLRARRASGRELVLDDVLPPFDGDGRHFRPLDDWSGRVDDVALKDELRRVVGDAIDALPVDYRTALVLHDVEGMPGADIAETLGTSLPGVKSLVHRSRLFLRRRLSEHFESV
jgi:RNA polymerase sigma-70 factor (ECF subfamily)